MNQEYKIDLSKLSDDQKGDVSARLHELQETCLGVHGNVGRVVGNPSTISILQGEGYDVEQATSAGRPTLYPGRVRSSIQMSMDVWSEIDRKRGNESRAVFVEQIVRQALGMPALEPID